MNQEHLEEFNEWWFTGKVAAELLQSYKREMFQLLADNMGKRQILSIVGLRRTGKTTLMLQLIQKLLDEGTLKDDILYFNFDEYVENLDDVLGAYRETRNKDFRAGKVFIFLDEIQKLKDWANQVKKYYDLYPQLKFVISGSEGLFIAAKSKETLAGRLYEFVLKLLSFKEFIAIKGVGQDSQTTKLKAVFSEYAETGGFPELVGRQNEMKEYVKSVVLDKVIFKDMATFFGIRDTETVRQLVEIIASNPGMYLDYVSLAQQLDKDRRSIKNYVMLLKESFLITILWNYRKGTTSRLRKLKRAYPVDSSIILAFKPVIDEQFMGRVVETIIVNCLNASNFWKNGHEIDAVTEGRPVEVKYQNKITDQDFAGLREFMKRFSVKNAVLVTKDTEGNAKFPEGEIELIPAWKFVLMPHK